MRGDVLTSARRASYSPEPTGLDFVEQLTCQETHQITDEIAHKDTKAQSFRGFFVVGAVAMQGCPGYLYHPLVPT